MKLKRIIPFLLLTVFFLACKKEDTASIKVKIKGANNRYVVLSEQFANSLNPVDSLKLRFGGQAKYELKIHQANFYKLNIGDDVTVSMIIHPGEKITITGEYDDFLKTKSIHGSEGTILLNKLYDSLQIVRLSLNNIKDAYQQEEDEYTKESLQKDYDKLVDQYRKFTMQFILENYTSLASLAAVYQEFAPDEFVLGRKLDLQFYKIVSDSLSKYYPKQRHVNSLLANYRNMHSSLIGNQLLNSTKAVVYDIPILKLPDLRGDTVSLSQFKGKYVLVNFWASWNKESLTLLPGYKNVYTKNKSKNFVVYNVSFDKSLESWKNVLNFEEIKDWINVSDTGFPNSKTRIFYNIQGIPTNYLINPEQTEIVAKNLNPQDLDRELTILLD